MWNDENILISHIAKKKKKKNYITNKQTKQNKQTKTNNQTNKKTKTKQNKKKNLPIPCILCEIVARAEVNNKV